MAKQQRQIIAKNNVIYIIGEKDFEPKHIFENGQAFRWEEQNGIYTIVADQYVSQVKKLSPQEIHAEITDGNLTDALLESVNGNKKRVPSGYAEDSKNRSLTENLGSKNGSLKERAPNQKSKAAQDPESILFESSNSDKRYAEKSKSFSSDSANPIAVNSVNDSFAFPSVIKLTNAGTMADYENFWHHYFDMGRDYGKLRKDFSKIDPHLKKAVQFGTGFRVLNQDLFEIIISFIISANNNIGRIKNTVAKLCTLAGEPLEEINGKIYYRFPSPEQIAQLSAAQITEQTGAGYRGEYIQKTAQMIADGAFDLCFLKNAEYEIAHAELLKLPGVGPKVADCILLFGNSMDIAFPVDTWVIKLMNHFYLKNEKNSKKIKTDGQKRFGAQAGIAQQYLFYYAREHKIGSKLK